MTHRQKDTTQVRYVGNAKRRTVNEYEWSAENGFMQTVRDAKLVERLVANGDFVAVHRAPDTEHEESKEQDI